MKGGCKVASNFKFYCSRREDLNEECVIPIGLTSEELFDKDLPQNCLDCQYYLDRKTKVCFEEYAIKNLLPKEN